MNSYLNIGICAVRRTAGRLWSVGNIHLEFLTVVPIGNGNRIRSSLRLVISGSVHRITS